GQVALATPDWRLRRTVIFICSSTAGKFLIEGDFYCQIITSVILTIKTFFLKISVNIILIQMPFPATPKTSLTVLGTWIFHTQMN
ncbi:hypothetical protein, partial [Roseburia intestinalis]|uniref:hypothetical protein n=1 Tax=Roseburia intestinalis TaxID=166486 RepID=UPI001A9BDA93